jgi:hypothetical protein
MNSKKTTTKPQDLIKEDIFSDPEAIKRIRIKKTQEKIEISRIKKLSSKPPSIEEKILSGILKSH